MNLYSFGKALSNVLLRFKYKLLVTGKENIPTEPDKGYILAANHITILDPIFLGLCVKRPLHFMAKHELFTNPIVAWMMHSVNAFSVSRGTGDNQSLAYAVDLVKNGKIMAIFPEGTRSRTGELLKAKSGVILIASQTKGDIVPVSIQAGGKKGFRRLIHIQFGKLIKNEELGVEQEHTLSQVKHASKLLMSRIAQMRQVEV